MKIFVFVFSPIQNLLKWVREQRFILKYEWLKSKGHVPNAILRTGSGVREVISPPVQAGQKWILRTGSGKEMRVFTDKIAQLGTEESLQDPSY